MLCSLCILINDDALTGFFAEPRRLRVSIVDRWCSSGPPLSRGTVRAWSPTHLSRHPRRPATVPVGCPRLWQIQLPIDQRPTLDRVVGREDADLAILDPVRRSECCHCTPAERAPSLTNPVSLTINTRPSSLDARRHSPARRCGSHRHPSRPQQPRCSRPGRPHRHAQPASTRSSAPTPPPAQTDTPAPEPAARHAQSGPRVPGRRLSHGVAPAPSPDHPRRRGFDRPTQRCRVRSAGPSPRARGWSVERAAEQQPAFVGPARGGDSGLEVDLGVTR